MSKHTDATPPLENPQILPPKMVFIKGGSFEMGDVMNDNEYQDEKPVHTVKLSSFWLAPCTVTFEEYDLYCKATGREEIDDEEWGRGKRPVIHVSWWDALGYCNWLSEQEGRKPYYEIIGKIVSCDPLANGFRLPTEAEWEYAAREGGKNCRFGNGKDEANPDEMNFNGSMGDAQPYSKVGEYRGQTVEVDAFAPNALGLYQMSGNVWEWCWDWYDSTYYEISPKENPNGPENGTHRVLRCGSWTRSPDYCRAARRGKTDPSAQSHSYGFRVCSTYQ